MQNLSLLDVCMVAAQSMFWIIHFIYLIKCDLLQSASKLRNTRIYLSLLSINGKLNRFQNYCDDADMINNCWSFASANIENSGDSL